MHFHYVSLHSINKNKIVFQLLVTLRCLAKGNFYSEAAEIYGVTRSSVSRHIWQVMHVHVGEHIKTKNNYQDNKFIHSILRCINVTRKYMLTIYTVKSLICVGHLNKCISWIG